MSAQSVGGAAKIKTSNEIIVFISLMHFEYIQNLTSQEPRSVAIDYSSYFLKQALNWLEALANTPLSSKVIDCLQSFSLSNFLLLH